MKLFSRVCMLFVALSCASHSFAMAEGEKENNAPKETSLFVHCMRPPLKTIYTMTDTLSYILGSATIIWTINLLGGALTDKDIKAWTMITGAWLVNKAIYHLSDYTLEEMS